MPRLLCTLLLSVLAMYAAAVAPAASDAAALEQRVMSLAAELRCLVCQNQTLADSHAELAVDLKDRIREKLARGDSEQEVRDFMVQRYGDFVLYRPPVKAATILLWFGPLLLLGAGCGVFWRVLSSRSAAPLALSEAERQRAASLLGNADTVGEKHHD